MGNVTITNNPLNIHLDDDSTVNIAKVQNIAPVAAHIKEVNHIDPISVDAFHVNEIRNIEPIKIEKFNVTNLPTMNMTVRQLPPVDLNIRKLPGLSIGTHQDFCVPSRYTVRAQLLGIEFLRVHLDGQTSVMPHERFRREQASDQNRSFPAPAVAGNPAIPSIQTETSVTVSYAEGHHHRHHSKCHHSGLKQGSPHRTFMKYSSAEGGGEGNSLSVGMPGVGFSIPESSFGSYEESSVSSGGLL